jgi:hypothetical protein
MTKTILEEGAVEQAFINPIDTSAEAILELEELNRGIRDSVPALTALLSYIRTPAPSLALDGQAGISMLTDMRSYAILRDSIGGTKATNVPEFQAAVERYLADLEKGVAERRPDRISEARRFCATFNDHLLSSAMSEIYQRRERADSRYNHEPLP